MKISRPTTALYDNDELFERRFTWMISKVLGGATLFFALAVAAQWGNFRGASSSHTKVRNERPVIVSNMDTVAFSIYKEDSSDATATM
jgi:hypothetical protein